MALNAYLRLKGQSSGVVKGSVRAKGYEGSILVVAASHALEAPYDSDTGLPTGVRKHHPFTITKESDRSSSLLYAMWSTNETIGEWELKFFAPAASGSSTTADLQTHTVKLTNARIAAIRFTMPNSKNPDLLRYLEYEEVVFTYQRITWIWNEGGITAQDDWHASVI